MPTEPTCEQRIRGYYAGRMETIGALVKAQNIDDLDELSDAELGEVVNEYEPDRNKWDTEKVRESAFERLDEMPLAVTVVRSLRIDLGTGGPGDWFECRLDEDGSIDGIVYHFNDWFDHAEINVSDDDNARAFCERFAEVAVLGA